MGHRAWVSKTMNSLSIRIPNSLTTRDRQWLVALGILLSLLLVDHHQAITSIKFVQSSLGKVTPFLLFSIVFAASAKASDADTLISRAFQGRTVVMVATASFIGALSPFCSCGVIPLIAALLSMGVSLAPVMAFWLASPLMDPAMFALTSGVLGVEFALAKTAAAIGIGLLGGYGIWAIQRFGYIKQALRPDAGDGGCGAASVREKKSVHWAFWKENKRVQMFTTSVISNLRFLGGWMVLAFLLESLMLTYVPVESILSFAGGSGVTTIVGAALLGLPAYFNGYAALPLVGGLIEQGMQPGAGLTFLLAGGVASFPAAIAVFALARLPVFFCYLIFAFIGSVIAGLMYGYF